MKRNSNINYSFLSIFLTVHAYGMQHKPVVTFNHSSQQRTSLSLSDYAYMRHEGIRNQISVLNNSAHVANNFQQLKNSYTVGFDSIDVAARTFDIQALTSFTDCYKNQPYPFLNSINQQTIDRLIPVLYARSGDPKLELNSFEKYQVARIVTDYLKATKPNEYVSLIKEFATQGNREFVQILKEETTYGSWLKLLTVNKPAGLIYGLFSTTSFSGTMSDFKDKVLNNSFCKHLSQVNGLAAENRFAEAKEIVDAYKNQTTGYGIKQYQALNKLYNKHLDAYCNRVCQAYEITNPTPEVIDLLQKIPLCKTPQEVARLIYETLARNQDDYIFVQNAEKLLNEHGLPRFYTYDTSILNEIALPSTITQEQIKDRLLLFDIALSGARNQNEKRIYSTVAHYVEKGCSNNPLSRCYSDLAHTTVNALRNPKNSEALVLECGDFSRTLPTQEHETLQRRTVPLVANLINEIKRLNESPENKLNVDHLKVELQNLNEQFQKAQLSPEAQDALAVTIARLNSELKTFSRAELYRSPSMEKLFRALGLDLLVSSKYGTVSYEELSKFSGTQEQNAVNHELMKHVKDVSLKAAFLKDDQHFELYETHKKLIHAIHQLNKDYRTTLASEGLVFAKDIFDVLTDGYKEPIKEVAQCAVDTVMHPIAYCSRTLDGMKNMVFGIADLAKHSSVLGLSSPEEQFAYAKACNESLHKFFNQWHQLSPQEKRKFAAQLVVDSLLNKAVGSIPKLLTKTTAFAEFSGALSDGIGTIFPHGPGISSGGALAVPFAESLGAIAEVVQDVGAIAVEGAASTPAAVSVAAVSNFGSLFRSNNGNGGEDFCLPPSLGKVIQKTQVDSSIKNDRDIIYAVEPSGQNVIKEFNISRKTYDHLVHTDHQLSKLGISDNDVCNKFIEKILKADLLNYLEEPSNQIETFINGCEATIRVRISDGKVISLNGFYGRSERIIGKLIKID